MHLHQEGKNGKLGELALNVLIRKPLRTITLSAALNMPYGVNVNIQLAILTESPKRLQSCTLTLGIYQKRENSMEEKNYEHKDMHCRII